MNRFWMLFLFLMVTSWSGAAYADQPVHVAYPDEDGQRVEADSTFVFGAAPPGAEVLVNGIKAITEAEFGAYLAFIPLEVGENKITVEARWNGQTAQAMRTVYYPGVWTTTDSSDGPRIDPSWMIPQGDTAWVVGDEVRVLLKGTTGASVSFSIEGVCERIPMVELAEYPSYFWGAGRFGDGTDATRLLDVEGVYVGSYVIQPGDMARNERLVFHVSQDDEVFDVPAMGRLSILEPAQPRVLEVTSDQAPLYASTGMEFHGRVWTWLGSGYPVSPVAWQPEGTRMQWIGQEGEYYRVRLSGDTEFWARRSDVRLLPTGTPLPRAQFSTVRIRDGERSSSVRMHLNQRIPVQVVYRARPHQVKLVLHNVQWHQDSIFFDHQTAWIEGASVQQVTGSQAEVIIDLAGDRLDGYELYFDGSDLVIELRQPPQVWAGSPLEGRVIVVDPGHGGSRDRGGTGPTGIHEKDVVLPIALLLADGLREAGAEVILTRATDTAVGLADRRQLAEDAQADLLISVHANAFPDGIDSTVHHGHSTIYTHPFHEPAAKALQNAMLRHVGFPNYGIQMRGNLAILRSPMVPSVLVEIGFMMHPYELAFMLRPDGQKSLAEALYFGIVDYFEALVRQ